MYVFLRNYRYNVKRSLNFEDMLKAAGYIRGTHDFKAFEAAGGTPGKSTVRNIYEIDINIIAHENLYSCGYSIDNEKTGAYDIEIVVTGDGFLYNMVRIIAGTLVDVGLGRIRAGSIEDIINSGDRSRAGHTAPAQGLCMQEVYFSMEDLNRGIFRYGRKS